MLRPSIRPAAEVDRRVRTEIVYLALGTLGLTILLTFFIWYTVQKVGLPRREPQTQPQTQPVTESGEEEEENGVADRPNDVPPEDAQPDTTVNSKEKDESHPAGEPTSNPQPPISASNNEQGPGTEADASRGRRMSLDSDTNLKEVAVDGRRVTLTQLLLDTAAPTEDVDARGMTDAGEPPADLRESEINDPHTTTDQTPQSNEAHEPSLTVDAPVVLPEAGSEGRVQDRCMVDSSSESKMVLDPTAQTMAGPQNRKDKTRKTYSMLDV